MAVKIEEVSTSDHDGIISVLRNAFPPVERDDIVRLALALLSSPSTPPVLALKAIVDDRIAGFVAFSPVALVSDENWPGYILSPLAVDPAAQGTGVGTAIVETGLTALKLRHAACAFVYGDPAYYGRFGFSPGAAERFEAPHKLAYPHGWQALDLGTGRQDMSGRLTCVQALDDPALW